MHLTPIKGYANALLDAAPDAMVISDSRGAIIYANQHAATLFGYLNEELIGEQVEKLLPERFRAAHPALRVAYARSPRLRPMGESRQLFARHRNGAEIQVEIRLSTLQTEDGLLVLSTIRDATGHRDLPLKTGLLIQDERVETESQGQTGDLSEARERDQILLNSIGDAVISVDAAGDVTYLNPIAEKMTGWSREDATGRALQEVLIITDDHGRKSVLDPVQSARGLNVDSAAASGILIRRDGSRFAVEHSSAPMRNDDGELIGAVMVFRDVSVVRAITQKFAHAAHHDSLTGLPNRLLLESRLTQAIDLAHRHNCEAALLFLDLDGFKLVNDTLGHPVGDRLLRSVAGALQGCVRSTDTVSRFGGDEFVVLLSEISGQADAAQVAEKILGVLRAHHSVDEPGLRITASVGIALYPHDGIDPQTLLRNADDAMFLAKRAGGNGYRRWSGSVKYV
ncbi:MAG: diguanylate cyclase [Steroidobacteraceae bacterium]|jgi:diguanylate cyclase (GGDEF)-like protein/PAS domain S-box-containing protein